MKLRALFSLILPMAVAAVPLSTAHAQQSHADIERFGLYIAVDDLDQAAAFYEKLFETKPQVKYTGLVGFDVAGGFYALVSKRAFNLTTERGSSVRPYIKVRDIYASFEHVKKLSHATLESEAVVVEGSFRFFRFKDPEGTVIEFFSIDALGH